MVKEKTLQFIGGFIVLIFFMSVIFQNFISEPVQDLEQSDVKGSNLLTNIPVLFIIIGTLIGAFASLKNQWKEGL